MKRSKFTESQTGVALKQHEDGFVVEEMTRRLGVSSATFYKWKQEYGRLPVPGFCLTSMPARLYADQGAAFLGVGK